MNKKIEIRGIVQGVGFRPLVYQLATRYNLKGFVQNTGSGVHMEVEGDGDQMASFFEALHRELPVQGRIDAMESREGMYVGYETFAIRQSEDNEGVGALIPPDSALCKACLYEMQDPSNRRYRYPFINCTGCGPRYTIMQLPPYDRVRTSMKHFPMCPECEGEYSDPTSRRYHAEPISCPRCGPQLRFLDNKGNEIAGDPIDLAVQMLKLGKIIALKGVGGFHLMCDATSDSAVSELRRRKHRKAKPFAVMFRSLQQIERYASINEAERELITGAIKPIVIVDAKHETALSVQVAPGIGRIGVFLPYTPLHQLLFEAMDVPLIATSANIRDEPIIVRGDEVIRLLGDKVEGILDHDRSIVNALDDSVVQIADGKRVTLRMGRGYAPVSFPLHEPLNEPVLAVGAHQKSAVALGIGNNMILGGHIGDLGSIEADEYFERSIHTFKRFYQTEPSLIFHDRHPLYTSTRYAYDHADSHWGIQHHYAHILACMAEYGLTEKVIGFAFDGTGHGDEGALWGGEVMIADTHTYKRIGSLKPFALLGGEKAIKEPRRIALSLLFERYSLDEVLSMNFPTTEAFLPYEIRQMHHMWLKKLNSLQSTSMGRLFDAVASLGGFVQSLDYEGQGGMIMEGYVDPLIDEPFAFEVNEGVIDVGLMVDDILALVSHNDAKRVIASRFIATISAMIEHFAALYPDLPVVVGGGVFQNRVLMSRLYRRFTSRAFYAQQRTPVNDGSIALGQAWWGVFNRIN
ncbi:carbamoyltransferase HypF [Sulfuricurvum sp.]|uniref:carbamoyltransferase HypF n=1 Tax=Sulfuricurvum sp. TaxID=2025608 RepID=UPI003C6738F8